MFINFNFFFQFLVDVIINDSITLFKHLH